MKGGIYKGVRWHRSWIGPVRMYNLFDEVGQPTGHFFDTLSQLMFFVDWQQIETNKKQANRLARLARAGACGVHPATNGASRLRAVV